MEEKGQILRAIIVKSDDGEEVAKESLGGLRVKVRVPVIHGPTRAELLPPAYQTSWTSDDDLPYAAVCLPVGAKVTDIPNSEMFENGEIVYVIFTSPSANATPLIIGTTGRKIEEESGS